MYPHVRAEKKHSYAWTHMHEEIYEFLHVDSSRRISWKTFHPFTRHPF